MKYWVALLIIASPIRSKAQSDSEYQLLKQQLVSRFRHLAPGQFTSFGKGVKAGIVTNQKVIALTFDACGGPHRGGYDEALIVFLRNQKIPATLFLSGLWIDEHPDLAKQLARDTLFEIENHGLTHRPCSAAGASRYGIQGTENIEQVVDEIELNAKKIEQLNHRKPVYFRAATATSDEACGKIVTALGEAIVNFDILSGDAVGGTPAKVILDNVVRKAHNGAIVIMHMNHPEWNGYEALEAAIPILQSQGYSFVKLQDHALKGPH
jgi:peptidoglycan/xylan/chitin deacetylase (PgdA/CDA1 family)